MESHLLASGRAWMSVVWFGMVCVTRRRGLQTIRQRSRHHRCNSEHMWLRPPCIRLRVLYSLFPQSEVSSSSTRFCNLSQSTTAPRGWATPFVPSLLGTAIILIVSFVLWEIRREAKGQSVLLPMSMFSQPGAKMGPVVLLVVFGWWGFNTQGYFIPLFFQQVKGLSPLKTALWLVPSGVSVRMVLHRMSNISISHEWMIASRALSRTSSRDILLLSSLARYWLLLGFSLALYVKYICLPAVETGGFTMIYF